MSDFITNAELRIEAERLCDENDQLKADNAKLRELVRDFDKCLDTILGLTGCKGFVILPDQELFDSLPVRMHELVVDE